MRVSLTNSDFLLFCSNCLVDVLTNAMLFNIFIYLTDQLLDFLMALLLIVFLFQEFYLLDNVGNSARLTIKHSKHVPTAPT